MKNNTLAFVIVAVVALAAGFGAHLLSKPAVAQTQTLPVNQSFPDWHGQPQAFSQWQGKLLIINFWATWCPPCLKEIPTFIKLQEELKAQNVQFVGIAVEDAEPVADYLKNIPVNYPMLVGGDKGILLSQQLGNTLNTVPFTVFVNAKGQIVDVHPGELSKDAILEWVEEAKAG